MDEYTEAQISRFRATAQTMGDAVLEAVRQGDAGLARTAARQAAQYARLVIQLETGEKQSSPEDAEEPSGQMPSGV